MSEDNNEFSLCVDYPFSIKQIKALKVVANKEIAWSLIKDRLSKIGMWLLKLAGVIAAVVFIWSQAHTALIWAVKELLK